MLATIPRQSYTLTADCSWLAYPAGPRYIILGTDGIENGTDRTEKTASNISSIIASLPACSFPSDFSGIVACLRAAA
jgi:hypothetical protein